MFSRNSFNLMSSQTDSKFYGLKVKGSNFLVPKRYRDVTVCGSGGQSVVVKAFDEATKTSVAIKRVLFNTSKSAKGAYREFTLLNIVNHQNIVNLLSAYTPESTIDSFKSIYIVMPCATTTLEHEIHKVKRRFTDEEILNIIYKLLIGLNYLHTFGIVHRDLKPGNIGIDAAADPIIFDFGLSRVITKSSMTKFAGTFSYMALEIFVDMTCNDHADKGTPKSDFLSKATKGSCDYIKGMTKYKTKTWNELIPIDKFDESVREDKKHVISVRDTISHMLKYDPEQRWGVQDLIVHFEQKKWCKNDKVNGEQVDSQEFRELCKEAKRNEGLWKELLFKAVKTYEQENDVFEEKSIESQNNSNTSNSNGSSQEPLLSFQTIEVDDEFQENEGDWNVIQKFALKLRTTKSTCLCGVNVTLATKIFGWVFLALLSAGLVHILYILVVSFYIRSTLMKLFLAELIKPSNHTPLRVVLIVVLTHLLGIVFTLMMLYGAYKKRPSLFWPYLMFIVVINLFYTYVFLILPKDSDEVFIVTAGAFLFIVAVTVYFGFIIPNRSRLRLENERYKTLFNNV
ncbi:Stress-activated protein kinase JNK [Aphelenchoides bicaudatus]|nr:Stress-activated protein kinase JNK [Aphelenchoides bicaudatus]